MNKTNSMVALLAISLAFPVQAATVRYVHTDALGSVVAKTDEDRVLLERREYEPFGAQMAPATVQDGPGYTGHVQDATTGLTYMQQRYYDPQIGRFVSADPISATSSGSNFSRYRYANNNPYGFVDPDGRLARRCAGSLCDKYREAGCEMTCVSTDSDQAQSTGRRKVMGDLTEAEAVSRTTKVQTVHGEAGETLNQFVDRVGRIHQELVNATGYEYISVFGEKQVPGDGGVQTLFGALVQTQGSHLASFGVYGPAGYNPITVNGQVLTMHNHGLGGGQMNDIDKLVRPDLMFGGSLLAPRVPNQDLDSFSEYDEGPGYLSTPSGVISQGL